MFTFPSEFKCAMDHVMNDQFINHTDCTINVYYGTVGSLKHTGIPFSEQPNLSHEDKRIIFAFNREHFINAKMHYRSRNSKTKAQPGIR